MDEIQKDQIICAIYIAINIRNYRCARTIFDEIMMDKVNETLNKVIELVEGYNSQQLTEKIRELKYEN